MQTLREYLQGLPQDARILGRDWRPTVAEYLEQDFGGEPVNLDSFISESETYKNDPYFRVIYYHKYELWILLKRIE